MKITVILCTYNRCQTLPKALESVAASKVEDSIDWEVLVVDNNSRDETRAVVESFCARYPIRFRYLFEPKPGKSNALNAGIQVAQGEILAFMDDDVVVDPTWLQNLTARLHGGEIAGVGGRILPNWTTQPPSWLPQGRYALAPLAAFDLGLTAAPLTEAPFGTNMAFRKTVFEKFGGFRTDLGPRPNSEIRNEDTEFGARLLKAGELLWYEPSAMVYHEVPLKRLQKQYFLTWWFDKARADVREYGIKPGTKLFVVGVPLYLFRRLAVWTIRWFITPGPSLRFATKIRVWGVLGTIEECYRTSSRDPHQELGSTVQ